MDRSEGFSDKASDAIPMTRRCDCRMRQAEIAGTSGSNFAEQSAFRTRKTLCLGW